MDALIEKALGVAPFMVIALTSVGYVVHRFLKHMRDESASRASSEDRFLKRLDETNRNTTTVVSENTKVMGAVLEHLRK